MIPIFEPYLSVKEKKYLLQAIDTGWISSQGKFITEFENEFAKKFNRKYAVATSNCTTALHLCLVALDIKPGDEVICPNLTFIAPANMISEVGAKIVLVDVDKKSWNLDPSLVEQAITEKTKAIMVVHAFGVPANMDKIQTIAKKNNIFLIEDNAESPGAKFKEKYCGSFGQLSCFSFFANKIITTGEGGMITTNNFKLYNKILELRDHGMSRKKKYVFNRVGYNYRMTNMQAAIGLGQLIRFEKILKKRQEQENFYKSLLENINGISIRKNDNNLETVHWLFTIKFEKKILRNKMVLYLKSKKIDSRPMIYPVNFAKQFKSCSKKFLTGISNNVSLSSLHLPSSTSLPKEKIEFICNNLIEGMKYLDR